MVFNDTNMAQLPAQYEKVADEVINGANTYLYETDAYRPIASLTHTAMSTADFESLSMAERDVALAQAAVVDDVSALGVGATLTPEDVSANVTEVDATVSAGAGTSIEGTTCAVRQEGSTLEVTFTATGSDTYLIELCDLAAEGLEPIITGITFSLKSEGSPVTLATVTHSTLRDHMSGGKTNWAVNLGTLPEGENAIVVTFKNPATYSVSSARVVAQSNSTIAALADQSAASGDSCTFAYENDIIRCSTSSTEPSALVITTPYSTGWTATVDGTPADVIVTDTAFMSVALESGSHEVELHYRTPGLLPGALISAAGIAATAIITRRCKQRSSASES